MLTRLVDDRMRKEGLSLREAAKYANTSHTTIMRILEGKQVDLVTLDNVCTWLGITITDVLKDQYGYAETEDETFIDQLAMFIISDNKLLTVLKEAFTAYKNNKLLKSDIDEIISFIAFKMSSKK